MSDVELPAWLRPPEWSYSEWADHLEAVGSIPDITASTAAGHGWDLIHKELENSGLSYRYFRDGADSEVLPLGPFNVGPAEQRPTLSVAVGPVLFKSYYWAADEIDFDVPIEVLGSEAGFECLVTFMNWVAATVGTTAVMTHEGSASHQIRRSLASDTPDPSAALNALRLADLRHRVFLEYRGVLVPGAVHGYRPDIDRRLKAGQLAREITSELCDVAFSATLMNVHPAALWVLADELTERWRSTLDAEYPNWFEVIAEDDGLGGPVVRVRIG